MKMIAGKIADVFRFYNRYGWKGVYSIFFKVYWTQDTSFINCGNDIPTLKQGTRSYMKGTYRER